MNSAINHFSAAQHQTDALREARRSPQLPKPERTVETRRRRIALPRLRFPRFAHARL